MMAKHGAKMAQDNHKMDQEVPKMAPKLCQEVPKRATRRKAGASKMAPRNAFAQEPEPNKSLQVISSKPLLERF
jgi:hypothetical protein